jgi:4-amino-4-deoxy-L-arabinose transferase-like glycosyltransferase
MKVGEWSAPGAKGVRLLGAAIVAGFVVLALAYSFALPVWEAPDEVNHFEYVRHLVTTRSLPAQRAGVMMQAHHPPLYYVLAAIAASPADINHPAGAFQHNPWLGWGENSDQNASLHYTAETFPYRGQSLAVHLIRVLSVLLGAGTVALTIAIGLRVFPRQPLIGLLAGAIAALNPQFLFISGAINNDNLLAFAVTGAIWQTLRAMERAEAWRQWLYLGLWLTVGMLAKTSAVVMVGVASVVAVLSAVGRRDLRMMSRNLAVMGAVVALGSGWWFLRNLQLYGDLLGWSAFVEVYGATLRQTPLQVQGLPEFFDVQFRSFWGVFGWMTVRAPAWYYTAIKGLLLLAVVGWVVFVGKGGVRELAVRQRRALLLLAGVVVGQELFVLASITRFDASMYQGRYLFPAIAPLAVLLATGVWALLQGLPAKGQRGAVLGLAAFLLAAAVYMVPGVISPAYESISLPKKTLWFKPNRLDATFAGMVSLRAYELEGEREGQPAVLTLYWQALERPDFDYSAFVHVVNSEGQVVFQVDGAPGEGESYPLQNWQAGDIVADRRQLAANLDSWEAPEIRIGLYNWIDGQRLPLTMNGVPAGDYVVIRPDS